MIRYQCDGCGLLAEARVVGRDELAPAGWSSYTCESPAWHGGEYNTCSEECHTLAKSRIVWALSRGITSLSPLKPWSLATTKIHHAPQKGHVAPEGSRAGSRALKLQPHPEQVHGEQGLIVARAVIQSKSDTDLPVSQEESAIRCKDCGVSIHAQHLIGCISRVGEGE